MEVVYPLGLISQESLVRIQPPQPVIRSVAQSGSASGLGPEGPRFESLYSDQFLLVVYEIRSTIERRYQAGGTARLVHHRCIVDSKMIQSLLQGDQIEG